ncbi:hypothetical protein CR513_46962, partial [Mucuna pruriens]
MEDNHFGQDRIKGYMQPIESDLPRTYLKFQQNMTATIQDLKTQIGQLADISIGSSNLRSQTIPNPRGNSSAVTLRSGKNYPNQHCNSCRDQPRLTLNQMPTHNLDKTKMSQCHS